MLLYRSREFCYQWNGPTTEYRTGAANIADETITDASLCCILGVRLLRKGRNIQLLHHAESIVDAPVLNSPPSKRSSVMHLNATSFPVGGIPIDSPSWVPRTV